MEPIMETFHTNVFFNLFNTPLDERVEGRVVFDVNLEYNDVYGTSETFKIFINNDGIGYEHIVPAGWSEYTYDPDITCSFYRTKDFDWFMRYALDSYLREQISPTDVEEIKQCLKK